MYDVRFGDVCDQTGLVATGTTGSLQHQRELKPKLRSSSLRKVALDRWKEAAAISTVVGAGLYAVIRFGINNFYDDFGLSPEDVGWGFERTLTTFAPTASVVRDGQNPYNMPLLASATLLFGSWYLTAESPRLPIAEHRRSPHLYAAPLALLRVSERIRSRANG